jgi:hypothetical protein
MSFAILFISLLLLLFGYAEISFDDARPARQSAAEKNPAEKNPADP